MKPRFLAAVALVGTLACGDPLGPTPEPITSLPRSLSVEEERVVSSSNAFGFELAGEVVSRDDRPNVVLSPLSASMALGMTLNGASAGTFDAMRSTLGFGDLTREEINDAYAGLIALLTELDPTVDFDVANAVWANRDVPFNDAFFEAVSDAFGATAESRDFADPSTLGAINSWAAENTRGLIDRIVEALDPSLVMLLVNAIYFDGAWTTEFDPADTRRQDFTRSDGTTVEVDMMTLADTELPLASGPDYAAVELPYGGEAFSMVVVVPTGDDDARALLADLDADGWADLVGRLTLQEVDLVALPKVTLTFDTYLNEALKDMGMEEAFGPAADFTRMSPIGDQLCIDHVRQKTFVEIDERGTRAAAVTSVGIGVVSFTGVVADRPYVFAIRERLSGTIVFVGLVGDPTAQDPGTDPPVSDCR